MKSSILILASGLFFAEACPPSPAPPVPDSGDAAVADAAPPSDAASDASAPVDAGPPLPPSVYDLACLSLKAAGCVEGQRPNCAVILQHVKETREADFDPTCLRDKHTKDDLRKCAKRGFVKCP